MSAGQEAPETGQETGSQDKKKHIEMLLTSAFGRRCDGDCNFACGNDIGAIMEAVEQYATARVWEVTE